MVVYNFRQQLAIGERAERTLDQYFTEKHGYTIHRVPINLQKLGIDRIFLTPRNRVEAWEYKADKKAHETRNAFIEIAIVREVGTAPGWAYTSQSNWIAYWVPGLGRIYTIHPPRLREFLVGWEQYPQRIAQNDGFHAVGVLVPLKQLEYASSRVHTGVTENHATNTTARKTIHTEKPVHSGVKGSR